MGRSVLPLNSRRPRLDTRKLIVDLLSDGRPRAQREIANELRLPGYLVNAALFRAWEAWAILRTDKPSYESKGFPKGMYGLRNTTRGFYTYTVLDFEGEREHYKNGMTFVKFSRDYFDPRSKRAPDGKSKSRIILE